MQELNFYIIAKSLPDDCSSYLTNMRQEDDRVILTYNDGTSQFDFTFDWIDGHIGFNITQTTFNGLISFQAIGNVVMMAETLERCCEIMDNLALAAQSGNSLKS